MPKYLNVSFVMLSACILLFYIACTDSKPNLEEPSLSIKEDGSTIQIQFDGQTILNYFIATQLVPDTLAEYYKRSGFIHPLKTLAGKTLTDGFPFDHAHQHGIFNAWTKTTFRNTEIDFWNQQDQLGTVRHKRVIDIKPSVPSFRVELEHLAYVNNDTVIVLEEIWDISAILKDNYYVFDLTSTQTCVSEDSLILNKYLYGGLAFRGSAEWNVENNYDSLCYFTTSDKLNQVKGNHTRPKWASMYGKIDDKLAGIAIIPHPSNLRYPSHIRVHSSMPYFCFNPTVDSDFIFNSGMELISKYRFVVFDGDLNKNTVENELTNWTL